MTDYTDKWRISFPEGQDDVAVHTDVEATARTTDAALTDAAADITEDVMGQVDTQIADATRNVVYKQTPQAAWTREEDEIAYAVVFDEGKRTWLEVGPDGRPTEWAKQLLLEVIGVGPYDLTRTRPPALADPGDDDLRNVILARNQEQQKPVMDIVAAQYPGEDLVTFPDSGEATIRPPTSIAGYLSVQLATGIWDTEAAAPWTQAQALTQTIRLINSLTTSHIANTDQPSWGTNLPPRFTHSKDPVQNNQWLSALTAMQTARAAWLIWPYLTQDERGWVGAMVVQECGRMPGATPPTQWAADGTVLRSGDSAYEDIYLQESILALALAMYPGHPSSKLWTDTLLRFRLTAASSPQDLGSTALSNGLVVGQIVNGYNLTADYEVENHKILPHPAYMMPQHWRFVTMWRLVHKAVPETFLHNAQNIWNTATTKNYPAPPYLDPGGVIYPGDGTWYSPSGNDKTNQVNSSALAFSCMQAAEMGWQSPFDAEASAVLTWEQHSAEGTWQQRVGDVMNLAEALMSVWAPDLTITSDPADVIATT